MTDLTYVYCLVRSPRPPVVPAHPSGMPGARGVRLLDAGGGLRLAVSAVPAADYGEAALALGLQNLEWVGRRAVAHEAVVEHFLTAPAVLPMQLFTLFTSDERALAHVARDRRRIDRILTGIERKHEWGLRRTFDEQSARGAVEKKHAVARMHGGEQQYGVEGKHGVGRTGGRSGRSAAGPARRGAAMADVVSGAAYLARKRDLRDVTRVQLAGAKKAADHLFTGMSRAAARSLRRRATEQAAPGARLLLDAAFLVPAARAGGFRAALRKHARALPAGVVVSLTGPWPPYNFVDAPARTRPSSGR